MLKFLKNIFRTESGFGISISDQKIQILQLENGKKVAQYGEKTLRPATVKNGIILDDKELGHSIKILKSELKIETNECALILPDNLVYEHIFFLPQNLSASEFERKLQALIEVTIPVDFNELKFTYEKINCGGAQAIMLTATKKEVFAQYYRTLREYADLEIEIITPEILAFLKNLNLRFDEDFGTIIVENLNQTENPEQKINCSCVWREGIFDSFSKDPENILTEIEALENEFTLKTKRKIKKIYLVGENEFLLRLKEQIQNSSLGAESPEIYNQFRINLENYQKIVGAAIMLEEKDQNRKFNLLEK